MHYLFYYICVKVLRPELQSDKARMFKNIEYKSRLQTNTVKIRAVNCKMNHSE